jgi:hypothetical protein
MSFDMYTKTLLTVIAGLLALLVLRPIATPIPAQAQSDSSNFYIEPGYTALRKPDGTAQLKGKVVIDRKTGEIWGFPTLVDLPYPVDSTSTDPPVSKPMYLGKFDFSRMKP